MRTIDDIAAAPSSRRAVQLTDRPGRPLFLFAAPGLTNSAWVDWQLARESEGRAFVEDIEGETPIAKLRRVAVDIADMLAATCLQRFELDGAEAPIEMGARLLARLAEVDPMVVTEIQRAVGAGGASKVEAVDIPGESLGG